MVSDGLLRVVAALPSHWHARYLAEVGSTQDEARAAARAGAPHRSLVVADYQRAGRGRQGRAWLAEPGSALLVSMVFRETPLGPPTPWRWTSLASVAVVEAIRQVAPSMPIPTIKWPNDVMLGDRKVAGILAETSWDQDELVAIVGIGVNVNAGDEALATLPSATSLKLASGHQVDRGGLLIALVDRIDFWLEQPIERLHATWQSRLWRQGQRARLLDLDRDEDVVILGADLDGTLRVRLKDGTECRSTTGELLA